MALLLVGCPADDTGAQPQASDPGDTSPETGDSGGETGETGDSGETGETGEAGDSGDSGIPMSRPEVILFIGDGMGFDHVRGGGMYASGAAGSLAMESLPFHGRLRTASLSGTTDSAASATAMATGWKTYNDWLGLNRDGDTVENLVERARAAGMSVGVVTTDKATGATPSGFVVHVEDRGDSFTIAEAFAADLPDVLLSGGYSAFEPLLATLPAQVVTDSVALAAAVPDGRPLVGLFADTTFPYVADGYPVGTPTLEEMTLRALDWLDDDPDGYFLMVEGARIDHASHSNSEERVFDEVASFDEAVAAALAWPQAGERTVVVTADHECGGLSVSGSSAAGVVPASDWRWGLHTNADVPVYAMGPLTSVFELARFDQLWVHAVLEASIDGAAAVVAPSIPLLVDGTTTDLGGVVTMQAHATSFGAGLNQLDALRVTSDSDGLWVGVDGVYERGDNTVLVLMDLDEGQGTGLASGLELSDGIDALDAALSAANLTLDVPGVGFDVAFGTVGAEEIGLGSLSPGAGLRGFDGALGDPTNLGWLAGVSNFDDGNIALGAAAGDAGATGLTEHGFEALIYWSSVFPDGIPSTGASVALVVVLLNSTGDYASNQALPPLASSAEPGASAMAVQAVVLLEVDSAGFPVGTAVVSP